jgi:hypothetical protein
LGLIELLGHFWAIERAPTLADWQALRQPLARFKAQGELVVIAPEWADPLARAAFGDELLPVDMLARADARGYQRAVEVSALGARSSELEGFDEVERTRAGPFTLRRLSNPDYQPVLYRFVDHVEPGALAVTEGDDGAACAWQQRAVGLTGGLHGNVAFPAQRFACRGGNAHFVGATIVDDQDYRPRRCIWAHAAQDGSLRLTFAGVTLGKTIRGYGGLSYFLARDGVGAPVELTVRAAGREIGSVLHRDESGFQAFELSTAPLSGTTTDVQFEIKSAVPDQRGFCFYAETL